MALALSEADGEMVSVAALDSLTILRSFPLLNKQNLRKSDNMFHGHEYAGLWRYEITPKWEHISPAM
ncbi:MAG: hypothetical protein ACLU6W_10060 [Lachnospiraceae bacterium]